MQIKYIPAFIMLVAAAIASILNIIYSIDILTGLKRLLLVIIIFYILGLVAKAIITVAFKDKPKKEETEEKQEEEIKADNTK